MHTEVGLRAVLRQVLQFAGYTFTEQPHPQRVHGGNYQSFITMTSADGNNVVIYGEALDLPYKARDSAHIYALEYVDRVLEFDIVDFNYSH